MSKIESITVHNFQCHKDLTLEFGQVTTIVGPSDSGKSALMRALDWVCFNRGRTALLVRRGEKDTFVSISLDGHQVVRTVTNNAYVIDGVELSCIGRSVPAEVTSLFRMSEDNLQRQHDYLFWFSAKGGELTRNFNRIVDLTKLDEWVRSGASIERSFKDRVRYCLTRMEELRDEETSLLPFESMNADFCKLKTRYSSVGELRGKLDGLDGILGIISQCDRNNLFLSEYKSEIDGLLALGAQYSKLVVVRNDIENALKMVRRVEKGTEYRDDLRGLVDRIQLVFSSADRHRELTHIIQFAEFESPNFNDFREVMNEYGGVCNRYRILSGLVDSVDLIESLIESKKEEFSKLKGEISAKTGGICPLCGNKLREVTNCDFTKGD